MATCWNLCDSGNQTTGQNLRTTARNRRENQIRRRKRGGRNGANSVREAGMNSCLPPCYMRSFRVVTSYFSWRTLREPPRQKVLKTTMKATEAFSSPERAIHSAIFHSGQGQWGIQRGGKAHGLRVSFGNSFPIPILFGCHTRGCCWPSHCPSPSLRGRSGGSFSRAVRCGGWRCSARGSHDHPAA